MSKKKAAIKGGQKNEKPSQYITPPAKRLTVFRQILENLPGIGAAAQRARLAAALVQFGSVTTYEAMRYLDIYDPRPRKFEMVHKYGWGIEMVKEGSVTESGETHKVGRYLLTAMPEAANDEVQP